MSVESVRMAHGSMADPGARAVEESERNWDDTTHDDEALVEKATINQRGGHSGLSTNARHSETDAATQTAQNEQKPCPVTWESLPRKDQLVILTFARFSEPLAQTSLMAYMFYQLKSFDQSQPDSTISSQAGILQASFSAAQFVTAVLWGRAADRVGRKPVMLVGLLGTCLSVLAFGFSKTFIQAVICRVIGGALNGNVGIMRTMISEIVKEKKYQSRAFLLLPTFLNIGAILGPIIGGVLADPVNNLSWLFGPDSLIGGKKGLSWMKYWPYALPNLVSALVLFVAALAVFLGLEETLESVKHRRDKGRQLGSLLARVVLRRSSHVYAPLRTNDDLESPTSVSLESPQASSSTQLPSSSRPARLPFRKIWTLNVLLSLLTHFFLIFNISTFNALIFTFLPTPRSSDPNSSFLHFTGGLGLSTSSVGLATVLIGLIGFPLQILLYPYASTKLGTLRCYRFFLPFSTVACLLVPFLAVLPNKAFLLWPSLTAILGMEVLARTLALPGSIILINNSSPSASALGTIHGVGQSVASAAKTIGPLLGGWGLGLSLNANVVGAVWWVLGGVTLLGWAVAWFIRDPQDGDEEKGSN